MTIEKMPERYMRAYYHTFTPTGVDAVDAVLEAIAMAGKAYHGTDMWDEAEQYGPCGYWDLIQTRANAAAALLTSSASYRAGAEDMRERAAGVAEETIADLSAEQAGWRGSFGADCAQPHDDEIQTRREIASAIRSLPLPDPQPTPTQESRDV